MERTQLSPTVPAAPPRDGALVPQLQQSEIFRDYHQAFETTTGLPLGFRSPGAFQAPLHASRRLNPFCALMARRNTSCAACLQLQERLENEAVSEPRTIECYAGLNETAVPVRVGDKLIGYMQTGQVFLRPPSNKRLKEVLRQIGVPETSVLRDELERAYFQTRVIGRKQYDSIVRLLAIFAQHLASVSNQILVREATAELPAIVKARAFIAEHQGEDMHLEEVARAANMSPFYFCKLFKRTTGLTFTAYLARLRIESAKQMLQNGHTRVCEAAYASGFQSLSQFNRVFRRVAGESPSEFRDHSPTGSPQSLAS